MWLLVMLACWNSKIDALEAELAALEEEIDELEDQVNAPEDTGAPADTETPEDTAPPELAPSVVFSYDLTGNSGAYEMTLGINVQGDHDAVRLQVWNEAGFEEVTDSCVVWDFSLQSAYSAITAEVWWNGEYECWEYVIGSSGWTSPSCRYLILVDDITCE